MYMYPPLTDHECVRNKTLRNLLHIGLQIIQVDKVFFGLNNMTLYVNNMAETKPRKFNILIHF